MMQKLKRSEQTLRYDFAPSQPPQLQVDLEEAFAVETEDAWSGRWTSDGGLDIADSVYSVSPPYGNPVSGPILINGVNRGDLLVVSVEEIEPYPLGVIAHPREERINLFDSHRWRRLVEPFFYVAEHELEGRGDGRCVVRQSALQWPLRPMIGTIAVAPQREVPSSLHGQGPWGGNIDCRDVKAGSRIFLNCYHDGGLLFVGDVHGSQGDGEFGPADETKATVVLRCSVVKKRRIPFVRIEKADTLVALGCARPLERAVSSAITNLLDWMRTDLQVPEHDAYLHVTANSDFRINVYQMAIEWDEMAYVAGAEIPKKYVTSSGRRGG